VKEMQITQVDKDTRNGLWNVLIKYAWGELNRDEYLSPVEESSLKDLLFEYWHTFFRKRVSQMEPSVGYALGQIDKFFFNCAWNEVFDFLDFTYQNITDPYPFMIACNDVLKRENSGYRFVGGLITPIISQTEIDSLEEALEKVDPISGARNHLESSIHMLSDRENPDYRNSIKESISAVEAICKALSGKSNATLGDTLDIIEKKSKIHGALKNGFKAIYGYTSDADGIRHAMLEASTHLPLMRSSCLLPAQPL
jgi:hypothetical protein